MNESGFKAPDLSEEPGSKRIPIGHVGGRYRFFKVRRYGKLHFEKSPGENFRFDPVTLDALRKEFELGYSLDHPGIVRYLSYENGAVYEEYIDGLTIREMQDRFDVRLLDEDFLADICRQILDALSYLHAKGIVHLDIKPENVMVTTIGNRVKIIDLGCARSSEFDTTEGATIGYMAPEQAQGGVTNVYTDLYLVGRLMEELSRAAGCSGMWQYFIEKTTAHDPSERCKSVKDALRYVPASSVFSRNNEVSRSTTTDKPDKKPSLLSKVITALMFLLFFILIWWDPVEKAIELVSKLIDRL